MTQNKLLILLGWTIITASCAPPTESMTLEPAKPLRVEISPTIRQTESRSTVVPNPIATTAPPEDEGCLETTGQMIQAELVDPELPRSLPYRVYLPPCAEDFQGQLPAMYLLHGLARTDAQWDELEADEIALKMMVAEQAPPFIMVMPWERLGLEYGETIVDYLIPHIESEYGASPDRGLRSIGGISRGAG